MVVWWLCWHRTILIRNIRQKQYSQFPPVPDFRKPWWGVAYVTCMTNLQALYAWVIRWHVTGMLSLAEHWQGRRVLSNHVCTHSVISMWHVVCLQHLARACSEQSINLSITWSRYRNAYQDLWIMAIDQSQEWTHQPNNHWFCSLMSLAIDILIHGIIQTFKQAPCELQDISGFGEFDS